MKFVRFTLLLLMLAAFVWMLRAAVGFVKTLDIWLLLALFVGCALTLPFMVYTLACAPEPDPVQTPHTPTEDDFI